MIRRAYAAAPLVVALGGCAVQLPPPGGPLDTTPPAIIASSPADGALGAGAVDSVTLVFDDAIDRGSLTTGAFLSPRTRIERWEWEGRSAIARFAAPLDTNRTYTLVIAGTLADRNANRTGRAQAITFSTGATADSATISGAVTGRRTRGANAWVLADTSAALRAVWDAGEAIADIAMHLTLADASGAFRFQGLSPGSYWVAAVVDRDANRAWDPDRDVAALSCDRVAAGARDSAVVRLSVGDPDERAVVRGVILDSTLATALAPDSAAAAPPDTAAADGARLAFAVRARVLVSGDTTFVTAADSTLAFAVDSLAAGRITLLAFRDDNGNGVHDPGEPASERVAMCLGWADDRRGLRLAVRRH